VVFDEDKEGIQAYIDRISRLVTKIRGCNGSITNVTITGHLLRGLPDSYTMIKVICNS